VNTLTPPPRRQDDSVQNTATAVIAATSKTPFKTAFSITMGIALGNAVSFLIGITALAALVTVVALVTN
jgi:threonine/homoserine/homoserine lactone efflux protein